MGGSGDTTKQAAPFARPIKPSNRRGRGGSQRKGVNENKSGFCVAVILAAASGTQTFAERLRAVFGQGKKGLLFGSPLVSFMTYAFRGQECPRHMILYQSTRRKFPRLVQFSSTIAEER